VLVAGKLYYPSLKRAIPERFRDEFLMIKLKSTVTLLYFTYRPTARCMKLSGEDLSRYSNKIESVGLRK